MSLYKSFCKGIEFKGSWCTIEFRSGTIGLNEELGRHRGKNGDSQCTLCGDKCERVVHVLWECPV